MKTYPRTNDFQTIYLNTVITNPNILVGDYTIYNDFVNDPMPFPVRESLTKPTRLLEIKVFVPLMTNPFLFL